MASGGFIGFVRIRKLQLALAEKSLYFTIKYIKSIRSKKSKNCHLFSVKLMTMHWRIETPDCLYNRSYPMQRYSSLAPPAYHHSCTRSKSLRIYL